jgi:SNF2 family DNA or RNA helicase
VHICAYDSLESVERNQYDGIIGDELHYIANEDSNRWRRMNVIGQNATWRVGMSGTPISNMLKSLWSQYYWLDGGRTLGPSFDHYRKSYFNTSGWKVDEKDNAEERVSHAISRVTMFLTMQQAFPDKSHKIQQVVRVPMTTEQASYYEKLRSKTATEVITGTVTMTEATTRLIKLLQVVQGFVIDDNGDVQRFSSAKLRALEEMLTGSGDLTDRRVVVWCRFRPDLEFVSEMLAKHKVT